MQIPPYYDAEYGSDYNDLDFFLDDDFARRSLIGGECYNLLLSVWGPQNQIQCYLLVSVWDPKPKPTGWVLSKFSRALGTS